jgi:hypothetical protein
MESAAELSEQLGREMFSKLKILLIANEFRTWYIARHLSYSAQLGIEEALRANGVVCQVLTSPWLPGALDLIRGQRFDQIWVAGRLDVFDEVSLAALAELSPLRIGLLSESSEYTAEECAISPGLKNRKQIIERRLPYLTHVAACDEKDADEINARGAMPAIWWPQAVPERFIFESDVPPSMNSAIFCGNPYALRRECLKHPELKKLMRHVVSREWSTIDPLLFTTLHLPVIWPIRWALPSSRRVFGTYLSHLRSLRQRCFERWLRTLQTGLAVVNLPHFVKTYAGRVVEGMAAGRPVISWQIPDRPRNRALFEDEYEILLFAKDNPAQLAHQIERLITDHELNRKIVVNARKKLRNLHTSEVRVRQILQWSTEGRAPRYTD